MSPVQGTRHVQSQAILRAIWPQLSVSEETVQKQYSQLLNYFEHELKMIRENADISAVQSTDGICSLIRKMKRMDTITRRKALDIARQEMWIMQVDENKLSKSVDIALRLWLTVNISSTEIGRQGLLSWGCDTNLRDLVRSYFNDCKANTQHHQPDQRLNPNLTAEFLTSNYGYTVEWTHNLVDHLVIDWKYKVITVYEHKIYLYNNVSFPEESIIPQEISQEAMDTLNLLFPFQDDATKRFLSRHKKQFYGLGFCNRPRKLELEDYYYWRHRIADLGYILRGPAIGLQQLRLDREGNNMLQISTFWITAAVGVVTVISIAVAVGATVYGVKQYNLALRQYRLSVAEACLEPAAREQLGEFCY
ncbi:Ff.00g116830.m01.CDS01 [Fusarium sp. VM40]|nr:Ff.00g116830.m01.CDS01 [Fusarium sp. VM40]